MFKSIEYRLIAWIIFLLVFTGCTVWCVMSGLYLYAFITAAALLFCLGRLRKAYRQYNSNIIFLLNALENGDYSFHLSAGKLSHRESELNLVFNRIKEILAGARLEVMENERFLGIIVESTAAGIIITDESGKIRVVNRAALKMLGMPVFTHLEQVRSIDPSYAELLTGLTPGLSAHIKVANEREEQFISISVTAVRIRETSLRIYSLTSIGNELEAMEMESWIKLIRVLTHEIMNSIAPINSLSETLLEAYEGMDGEISPGLKDDTLESFRTINSTSRHLLSFVESYRRFSGIGKPELALQDMNLLVSRALAMQSAVFEKYSVEVVTSLSGEGGIILADATQIGQVLVNLLMNAADATRDREGARISIITRSGAGIFTVEVCNNGAPIPKEVEPHIFIPFFTTKETGTGIGLSLSRYIMRLHGGNLKYHRTDDLTVFTMVFPVPHGTEE